MFGCHDHEVDHVSEKRLTSTRSTAFGGVVC